MPMPRHGVSQIWVSGYINWCTVNFCWVYSLASRPYCALCAGGEGISAGLHNICRLLSHCGMCVVALAWHSSPRASEDTRRAAAGLHTTKDIFTPRRTNMSFNPIHTILAGAHNLLAGRGALPAFWIAWALRQWRYQILICKGSNKTRSTRFCLYLATDTYIFYNVGTWN